MKTRLALIGLTSLFVLMFFGCATTELHKKASVTEGILEYEEQSNPAYELLRSAEGAYAEGVVYNMKRDWDSARAYFDEALRLIAQIDAADDEDLSTLTDLLLREIAYDYRFALAHTDSLEVSAAPVVLSAALEGLALTDFTKQRLAELAGDLPKALMGEFDIPVVWNDKVKEKIIYFQTDAREPFGEWLKRSGRYIPMIKEILASKGLPLDLAYLPLIESGFAPNAYSWAHAVGMWQFIKSTGRMFGLDVNWWLDERRDPEKATIAAADYFNRLYRKFGNWELCLAAYNCGDGRIKRTIEKQGTDNYWELELPTETRNYVPLYLAALIIAKDPEAYGFSSEYYKPYEYETIEVNDPTNLDIIAQCTDTTLSFIQILNPEVLRYCTPPDATSYEVRIPEGKARDFPTRYAAIPEREKTVWARHQVKKGETLSEIALHYSTSVGLLTDANKLRSAHRLRIGQELIIPVSPSATKSLAAKGASPSAVLSNKTPVSVSSYHVVKKGNTLSEIANDNGVSLEELLISNSLKRGAVIKPGMRLSIPRGKTKTTYTVCSGDTPSTIAARFGVSTNELLKWNSINRKSTIYPGQKLTVLASESQKTPKGKIVHTVQKGESLWSIARRYDVHVSNLVSWNGLSSKNVTLSIGQKLNIIGDSPASYGGYTENRKKITYTVKKGDNLGKIAGQYSVTVEAIQRWNNKKNTRLQIGDKLAIYTDEASATDVGPETELVHTVKSGETLSTIALHYGVSTSDIKAQNSKSSDKIIVGEKLNIRTSTINKENNKITVHTVKSGETLSRIAANYSVRVADLKEWNNKKTDVLAIGEELEIHGVTSPVVSPSRKLKTIRHSVQSGENMSQLAVKYDVKVKDIMKWNEKTSSNLSIGEVLEIKTLEGLTGFGGGSTLLTHCVKQGETIWGIAKKYGTTPDAILNSNSNINPNRLKVGDILKVKIK
ncbi:LysM peptidoglycan-binding domain-containing protein [bacterium]|nr:LysM peptidoglycan-binding domain-containing protein [bacterium]